MNQKMEEASAVTAAAIEHTEMDDIVEQNGIENSSLDEESESMIPDDSKGDEEREIDSAKEALLQVITVCFAYRCIFPSGMDLAPRASKW